MHFKPEKEDILTKKIMNNYSDVRVSISLLLLQKNDLFLKKIVIEKLACKNLSAIIIHIH